MKIHDNIRNVLGLLVRDSIKKWCLYINLNDRSKHNIKKYCRFLPNLKTDDQDKIGLALLLEGWCLIECENERQCSEFYRMVDGEDTGGAIYAATIGDDGKWKTENT